MFENAAQQVFESASLTTDAEALLNSVGFRDCAAAHQRLLALKNRSTVSSGKPFANCLPVLLAMLSQSAAPDESLVNFERYVHAVESSDDLYDYLAQRPRATEILIGLFVGSQFLTEILLRNPDSLRGMTIQSRMAEVKSRNDYQDEAIAEIAPLKSFEAKLNGLRRYQQRQILRLGTCDAFGLMDLKSVTLQLSLLAGALIQVSLNLVADDLDISTDEFCVLAMGKLGGEELNYSSDIDLIFLAEGDASRFWPLGQRLIHALMENISDGFLYRVDMRLRPWGQSGALVNTIAGHMDYLSDHGAIWEKQALVKARFVAGEPRIAQLFLRQVEPIVYSISPDLLQHNIRNLRTEAQNNQGDSQPSWSDVKSGVGSIRDIEFTTQFLQLIHGGLIREVRSPNTLDALIRLSDFDIIHAAEYRLLTSGYILLRTIEHSLQLMHNKQTHVLPTDERQLNWLARRLDFPSSELFLQHCESWCGQIRRIYNKFIELDDARVTDSTPSDSLILQHLARMEPSYSETFSAADIQRHAEMLQRVKDEVRVEMASSEILDGLWQLTVVGHDHPGDLSVMSGLLFVYGFDIVHGNVFTDVQHQHDPERRMFVNVFTLRPTNVTAPIQEIWPLFEADLHELIAGSRTGDQKSAQSRLVKRVARTLRETSLAESSLYPVEIEIDNTVSDTATVLNIRSEDTVGFLYELANALTLSGIDIRRVVVTTLNQRVFDTLHVTDLAGNRIVDADRLQQLRAAIVLIKHFTHLLPKAPNPERALRQFHEFVSNLFERPDWVDELASLESPDVLNALARLLGVSSFLWDDFLRLQHENLFPVVRDVQQLSQRYSRSELQQILDQQLESAGDEPQRQTVLNRFKDRQLFRTDMRHILGVIDEFGDFSRELTEIAEVVVTTSYRVAFAAAADRHGRPLAEDGQACRLAIFSLGKCGGRELGFASDIELMFVYDRRGQTDGDDAIAASDFYRRTIQKFSQLLETKQEGIFQVDLRLRPYGQAGPLAVSLDAFCDYFGLDGAAWPYERQAMIKLRPIGGHREFAAEVMQQRDKFIYRNQPFDYVAMRALREKQIRQMVSGPAINAKLSPGGLVDCEYLVQAIQQEHGYRAAELRTTNTLEAIHAIRQHHLLDDSACDRLVESYVFLRRLIDALRMVRGNARDLTIPDQSNEEFEFLARRLGYGAEGQRLAHDLERHFSDVWEIVSRNCR